MYFPNNYQNIKQEIEEMAAFYAMDKQYIAQRLAAVSLDNYVEFVLAEHNFDIVVGGFNETDAILKLAHQLNFPISVIDTFEACLKRFPNKMLYAKLSLVPNGNEGTLYLGVLEPWHEVLDFLFTFPDLSHGIQELKTKEIPFQLCFLLAFSADKKQNLVAKIYHLLPQNKVSNKSSAFLKAFRVSKSGLNQNEKLYTAHVNWQNLPNLPKWQKIYAFANQLVGEKYAIHLGETSEKEQKIYIFRFDKRENMMYSHQNYNYYVEEGNKLLQQNKTQEALSVFQNAVDFNPADAHALNGLAYCLLDTSRFIEGIEYALKAKTIQPKISNLVWSLAIPADIDQQIDQITQQLTKQEDAELINKKGILHFLNKEYDIAIECFKKALDLKLLHPEYLNNLGGAYLKIGQFVEALKCCNTAYNLSGKLDNNNLSIAQEVLRLKGTTEKNPSKENFNNLGILFYKLDLFEEAKRAFLELND